MHMQHHELEEPESSMDEFDWHQHLTRAQQQQQQFLFQQQQHQQQLFLEQHEQRQRQINFASQLIGASSSASIQQAQGKAQVAAASVASVVAAAAAAASIALAAASTATTTCLSAPITTTSATMATSSLFPRSPDYVMRDRLLDEVELIVGPETEEEEDADVELDVGGSGQVRSRLSKLEEEPAKQVSHQGAPLNLKMRQRPESSSSGRRCRSRSNSRTSSRSGSGNDRSSGSFSQTSCTSSRSSPNGSRASSRSSSYDCSHQSTNNNSILSNANAHQPEQHIQSVQEQFVQDLICAKTNTSPEHANSSTCNYNNQVNPTSKLKSSKINSSHRQPAATSILPAQAQPQHTKRRPSLDNSKVRSTGQIQQSTGGGGSGKQRRLYKCRHCSFETDKKVENWKHIRIHMRPEKLLACDSCQFVTEYKHHLEYHQRNHSGYKPFKCDHCEYQCVNKSMLNSHMKSHSSVYQYQCGDCKYATKYVHSLKMHLRKYNHQPTQLLIDIYGRKRGPKSNSSSSSTSNNSATQPPIASTSLIKNSPEIQAIANISPQNCSGGSSSGINKNLKNTDNRPAAMQTTKKNLSSRSLAAVAVEINTASNNNILDLRIDSKILM